LLTYNRRARSGSISGCGRGACCGEAGAGAGGCGGCCAEAEMTDAAANAADKSTNLKVFME
jgi:hypothetical protein